MPKPYAYLNPELDRSSSGGTQLSRSSSGGTTIRRTSTSAAAEKKALNATVLAIAAGDARAIGRGHSALQKLYKGGLPSKREQQSLTASLRRTTLLGLPGPKVTSFKVGVALKKVRKGKKPGTSEKKAIAKYITWTRAALAKKQARAAGQIKKAEKVIAARTPQEMQAEAVQKQQAAQLRARILELEGAAAKAKADAQAATTEAAKAAAVEDFHANNAAAEQLEAQAIAAEAGLEPDDETEGMPGWVLPAVGVAVVGGLAWFMTKK